MKIKDEKIIVSNVALWFAKNENGETVTINDLDEDYNGKYYCPLCGSEVIAKALESEHMSPHFAHHDKSKCKGETVVHWWVKNELLKIGEEFEIITDKHNTYTCKNIEIEKSYETSFGIYRPDISIETDCGKTVFIEINLSNKKSDDYFDKWEEIGNTVVELNLKDIMYSDNIHINNKFGAIYYKGKRRNIDKNSKTYSSYIKSIKDKVKTYDKKVMDELEWFIDDVYEVSLIKGSVDYSKINDGLDIIKEMSYYHKTFVESMYKNSRCGGVLRGSIQQKLNNKSKLFCLCYKDFIDRNFIEVHFSDYYRVWDRLFGSGDVYFELNCKNIADYYIRKSGLYAKYNTIKQIKGNDNYIDHIKREYNSIIPCNINLGIIDDDSKYNECLCAINNIKQNIIDFKNKIDAFIDDTKNIRWKNILFVDDIDTFIYRDDRIDKELEFMSDYKNIIYDDKIINDIKNRKYDKYIDINRIKKIAISSNSTLLETYYLEYITLDYANMIIENIVDVIRKKVKEYKTMDILYNNLKHIIDKISSKNSIKLKTKLINEEMIDVNIIDDENNYKIIVTKNEMKINYVKICTYNGDKVDDFKTKFLYCINLCLGKDFLLLDDSMCEILFKLKSIYEKKTTIKYSVTCDLNSFYIWKYNDIIGEYEYSNNTTYDDVINCFSDVVRLNLYGTK